jgi:hypothetical protein
VPGDSDGASEAGARARGSRSGAPLCGACGRIVADDDPALYEVIAAGEVAGIVLTKDEPFTLPEGAALVDIFHPSCFRELVARWDERGEGAWSGRCQLSGRTIIAPHPLTACPVCGAAVIERPQRDAPA